ncbi:hypothetical protein ACOMHN_041515 [Nucella lapillus]
MTLSCNWIGSATFVGILSATVLVVVECPHGLGEQVSREAFRRALQHDLHDFLHHATTRTGGLSKEETTPSSTAPRIEMRLLRREVEIQVYKVCTEWNQQLPAFIRTPPAFFPVSVHAIKNTRRRMEDRHVILPDLNTLFQLQDRPRLSYYAVFDGHGGPEAAIFAASQLHVHMLRDPAFPSDPEVALKSAYSTTDRQFLRKAAEMKLNCGTTGVSVLLRGDRCYVSWLGDSQVMLVREGRAVTLMEPHKPDREDEQRRIEELGGYVINCDGVWRVRGNISVSRAIGDPNEKPFLCSQADTCSFQRTGTEDYLVLACDGIWDVLDPGDVPFLVHTYLAQHPGGRLGVARHLVARAKEMRSTDNISCVVVFLREDLAPPQGLPLEGLRLALPENGGGVSERASDVSGSQPGSLASSSMTSAFTGSSLLTLGSAAGVVEKGEKGVGGGNLLYGPGRQIASDFPHKLERQTGFFFYPSLRSLRTGHHKQQLLPLQEGRPGRTTSATAASHEILQLMRVSKKDEPASIFKPKPLSKPGSSKKGPFTKRKSKPKRRKGRSFKTASPDSSLVGSIDRSMSADLSLTSLGPSSSVETLAKHTSLAEILQRMADPADENTNPNPNPDPDPAQDLLSVRGTPACLHDALPKISARTPTSSLLNTTTSMTPVATSTRLPEPPQGMTWSAQDRNNKPRPFNL